MRLALILLLLAGCATPEQRAERDIAKFAPYCEKLGHQRDTDKWRECIQTNVSDAKATASRASAAAIQSRPKTCNSNGSTVTCY